MLKKKKKRGERDMGKAMDESESVRKRNRNAKFFLKKVLLNFRTSHYKFIN